MCASQDLVPVVLVLVHTILCKSVSFKPSVLQIIPFFAFCGKCFHRFMEYVSHLGALSQTFFCSWVRLCIKIESSWNISYAMTKPCWGMALRMVVNSSNTEFASLPCLSPAEKVVGSLGAKRYHLKSDVIGASPEMCSFGERWEPQDVQLWWEPRDVTVLVRAPRCDSFGKSPKRDVQFWWEPRARCVGLSKVRALCNIPSPQSEPRGSLLVTRNKSADDICSVGVAHCM